MVLEIPQHPQILTQKVIILFISMRHPKRLPAISITVRARRSNFERSLPSPQWRMVRMKSSTLLRAVSEVVLENARAWAEAAAEAGGDGSFGISRASGGVPAINDHSLRNESSDPYICFSV